MRVARGFDVLRNIKLVGDSHLPAHPPRARDRLRGDAINLARDESLVEAAYCYRVVALDEPASADLIAEGEMLHAPRLLPDSGTLTSLAFAVCTIGTRLERRVSMLFSERKASLALALNDLGNELLFEVSRRAQDRISADVARRQLSMAGELRAGDPGLALEAQGAVLRLARAETIGVSLTASSLMFPVKTTSMVLGVGIDLPPANWSRCDECTKRDKCRAIARTSNPVGH